MGQLAIFASWTAQLPLHPPISKQPDAGICPRNMLRDVMLENGAPPLVVECAYSHERAKDLLTFGQGWVLCRHTKVR